MIHNPRNQAEALTYLKRQEKNVFADLLKAESELLEFLTWAELPMSKKIRERFIKFEGKIFKIFKDNKWTEAEGRGIAYLFQFTGILEEMVKTYREKFNQIQQRKQKEG